LCVVNEALNSCIASCRARGNRNKELAIKAEMTA